MGTGTRGNGVDRDGWPADYVKAERGSSVIFNVDRGTAQSIPAHRSCSARRADRHAPLGARVVRRRS